MKPPLRLLACLMGACASVPLFACGVCVEDRVAATYDHAIITAAIARHQQVVFVGIDGPVAATDIARRIATAARKVPGLAPRSLRTSSAPLAFSFALDGSQDTGAAVAPFRSAMADTRARLTVMRVMRDGKLTAPD
jgi:chloramphenicol 3-O-phosphotransferase